MALCTINISRIDHICTHCAAHHAKLTFLILRDIRRLFIHRKMHFIRVHRCHAHEPHRILLQDHMIKMQVINAGVKKTAACTLQIKKP